MSLVGTRPILQDELLKYELHHRARIAIKPGITGMWQVSGRSDITDFEEVVRLDTEYISTDGTEWEKWKVALEAGDKGSWEERVNRASVCKIDGKWLMWYTGQSRNNSAIGIATSDDGIRFTRMQQKPILVPSEPYEKGSVMNP